MNNNNKWDELSLTEKSEVMRQAVANGITDLNEIRQTYNEYADGGSMDEPEGTVTENRKAVESAKNKYPMLTNLDFSVYSDSNYRASDYDGYGDIEVFHKGEQRIDYTPEYSYPNPNINQDNVLYNPDRIPERYTQDAINLDAISHLGHNDPTYDALNATIGNEYPDAATSEMLPLYEKMTGKNLMKMPDSKRPTKNKWIPQVLEAWDDAPRRYQNAIDGLVRDYIISKEHPNPNDPIYKGLNYVKYNPQWDSKNNAPFYLNQLYDYITTGRRPANILPEVIVTGKRIHRRADGGRLYDDGGKVDIYDKSAKVGNKTYPARTMLINGKETPVFLADDNRMYAVGDDKTPFEIWSQYSLPEVTVTPSKNKDKITGNYYNNSANRYYDSSYDPNGFMDKYSFMDKLKMSMMNKIPLIPDPTTFNAPFDNVTGNVNDRTSSVAQVSYLLPRDKQQKLFEDYGYKRVYNDYGTVKRAAESKGYPIYQKNSDDVSRENLVPIGNADSDPFEVETTYKGKLMEVPTNWYAAPNKSLIEAGANRSTIYYNPDNGKYYQKAWDLNDYGGNGGSTADIFGKFLDTIGNPVVVTSGIQEVLPENINKVEKNYMLPYAKKHHLKKADNGHWGYVAPDVIIYGHKHADGGKVAHDARYNHVTQIYQSYINQGVNHQTALELTNQKIAEKGWTGWVSGDNKRYNDVNSFTNHTIDQFNRLYPDSLKSNNFNQFFQGIEGGRTKYNPTPNIYRQHLLQTRPGVKKRINEYRRLQGQSPLSLVSPTSTPLPWEESILYNPQLPLEVSTEQPVIAADGGYLFKRGGKLSQQNQRAGYAVDYFMNKGLSKVAAAGLVGNLMRESRMDPNALNPDKYGGAHGLAQFRGARWKNLQKMYGSNPTFEQQLDYIWHELNTTHKKGLQMLKSSKTVDEAAKNAFGYYEFSKGPENAIAQMAKYNKKMGYNQANGYKAMNDGITNAWVAYGKANPNAKLQGLNVNAPVLGYNRTIPNYDFTSAVDGLNVEDSIANFSGETPKFQYDLFPPNPTNYGTPINWSIPEKKVETPTIIPKEDNNGLGLFTLINQIYDSPKQEPLATYTPQRNNSMFVVSVPTSNDTFLDSSWFKKGGYLYGDGGTTDDESSIGKAYDKFKDSTAGTVASFIPIVGTAMDGIELIRHPSWENAGWFGVGLVSDIFGGRIAAKAARTAAKKVFAKGASGYVLRRTPRGTIFRVPTKVAARNSAATTRLGYIAASSSDNFAQYSIDKNREYRDSLNNTKLANDTSNIELANDTEFGYGEYDPADPPLGLIADYAKKYGKAEAKKHFALDSK